jgi:prepilin-type N-terminal cleavage/methylation domain-containing protein
MLLRAGFTLLEVMVGLVVASLALGSGMAALGFVGERAAHADAATAVALEGATARQLIMDWLAGARLRGTNGTDGFQGLDVEYENLPDDILLFPSTATTHLGPGETIVRLYIDRNEETPERGLVAELTVQRGLPSHIVELVPGAAGLQLRYLGGPIGSLPVEWQDQWVSRNQLPRGLELTIVPARDATLHPLLLYPLRVSLGTR